MRATCRIVRVVALPDRPLPTRNPSCLIAAAVYEEKPRAARRPSSISVIARGESAPRSRVTSSG